LGSIFLSTGSDGSRLLLAPKIAARDGQLIGSGVKWNAAHDSATMTYKLGQSTVTVAARIRYIDSGIEIEFNSPQPVFSSVSYNGWAAGLGVREIPVPYYTSPIWYSSALNSFLNVFWDWDYSSASKFSASAAQYTAKTDGTLNTLHERIVLKISSDVDQVFPDIPNQRSPYMAALSGRLVLDIFDGGFAKIADDLAQLGSYGITHCVAIIHDWQHEGFDNALPEQFPANPMLGGSDELKRAISQGKINGCLMAVHENYVDYYPNYPKFNPEDIALDGAGNWLKAYFHKKKRPSIWDAESSFIGSVDVSEWHPVLSNPLYVGIQAYQTKPSLMVKLAKTQSPSIKNAYAVDAGYFDVLSGTSISAHTDMDARVPESGMLAGWMHGVERLWAYERHNYDGPIFGEGRNHWYYSGKLDGVEAQLGAGGTPQNWGGHLPLFVDFDLIRIHPLQVNHGMGYYERWVSDTLSSDVVVVSMLDLDAYRMQEVAFGHAPYLGRGLWDVVPLALIEQNLVGPVAARYGASNVDKIWYRVNSRWVSSSDAASLGMFDQLQVIYKSGLVIVANASRQSLVLNNVTLPQYGWAAKAPGLDVYSAQCGTAICDYAHTPTSLFASARTRSLPDARQFGENFEANVTQAAVQNFGLVKTNGMIALQQHDGMWVLRPFPRNRPFTVLLRTSDFPAPTTISAVGGLSSTITPIKAGSFWRLPLDGASTYSWPTGQK
jgi:hypothetical protein